MVNQFDKIKNQTTIKEGHTEKAKGNISEPPNNKSE